MSGKGPASFPAAQLLKTYKILAQKGHFDDAVKLAEMAGLCGSCIETLAPPQKVVAFVLKVVFETFLESKAELARPSATSSDWSELNTAMFEAIAYLRNENRASESVAVAVKLIDASRFWFNRDYKDAAPVKSRL